MNVVEHPGSIGPVREGTPPLLDVEVLVISE
jgi:hypothetical protein